MKKAGKKLFTLVVTLLLSLSLVLGGCSSPTPSSSGTNDTPQTFNMGGLFTLTGTGAVLGVPEKQGVEMAIQEINDAGGLNINGNKVKINFIPYDVGEDPAKVVDFSQRLVNVDKVKVIAGARENTQIAGELKITDPAKVIIYSGVASTPLLSVGSSYGLNITDNGAIEKHALIQLLSESADKLKANGLDADRIKKAKRIALFGRNELYVQQGVAGGKEAAEKLGFQWAGSVLFPPGTTDFLPYVNKLKELKPDVVILDTYSYDLMIPPLKDMQQVGGLDWTKGDIILMGNDVLGTQPFVDEAKKQGISLNGALCFSATPAQQSDKAKTFIQKVISKYGESPLSAYIAVNYDATMTVLKGIEASGTIDDADKMMQGIKNNTWDGMNFPMKINDQKQLDQPEFMLIVKDDKVKDIGIIYKDELYYGYALKLVSTN